MKNFMLFLAFVSLFVSCAIEGEDAAGRLYFDRETFNAERRLWLDQDLQNYSFHLELQDHALGGLRRGTVIVKNGVLDSFIPDGYDYGDPIIIEEYPDPFVTWWIDSISGIYEKINNSAVVSSPVDGFEIQTSLELEYDSAYHFFKRYFYSWSPIPVEGKEIPTGFWSGYSIYITDFVPNGEGRKEIGRLLFDRETFNAERQLWLDQGFQNYSFHLSYDDTDYGRHDFWSGTVVIKDGVLDGFVTDESDAYGNPIEDPKPVVMWCIDSISNLYKEINNAAKLPPASDGLALEIQVDMEYDSAYHFFTSWFYSWALLPVEGREITGRPMGELYLYITNFALDEEEDAP
jgi:hypothetical protein